MSVTVTLEAAATVGDRTERRARLRKATRSTIWTWPGIPILTLNAYLLALVWALWGLAARFTLRPLWAALLVASAPVVQVAGNSLETDAPHLGAAAGGSGLLP